MYVSSGRKFQAGKRRQIPNRIYAWWDNTNLLEFGSPFFVSHLLILDCEPSTHCSFLRGFTCNEKNVSYLLSEKRCISNVMYHTSSVLVKTYTYVRGVITDRGDEKVSSHKLSLQKHEYPQPRHLLPTVIYCDRDLLRFGSILYQVF